jgi:hypothetical protein
LDSAGHFGDPGFVVMAFANVDFDERHGLISFAMGPQMINSAQVLPPFFNVPDWPQAACSRRYAGMCGSIVFRLLSAVAFQRIVHRLDVGVDATSSK